MKVTDPKPAFNFLPFWSKNIHFNWLGSWTYWHVFCCSTRPPADTKALNKAGTNMKITWTTRYHHVLQEGYNAPWCNGTRIVVTIIPFCPIQRPCQPVYAEGRVEHQNPYKLHRVWWKIGSFLVLTGLSCSFPYKSKIRFELLKHSTWLGVNNPSPLTNFEPNEIWYWLELWSYWNVFC